MYLCTKYTITLRYSPSPPERVIIYNYIVYNIIAHNIVVVMACAELNTPRYVVVNDADFVQTHNNKGR